MYSYTERDIDTHMCVYIYIYIYIHMYAYMYICIHLNTYVTYRGSVFCFAVSFQNHLERNQHSAAGLFASDRDDAADLLCNAIAD